MNYTLRILWNTKPVMQADCSSAMAYDTMQMVFGNFVNIHSRHTKRAGDIPTLDDILSMESGKIYAFTISDPTGSMTVNITRK